MAGMWVNLAAESVKDAWGLAMCWRIIADDPKFEEFLSGYAQAYWHLGTA